MPTLISHHSDQMRDISSRFRWQIMSCWILVLYFFTVSLTNTWFPRMDRAIWDGWWKVGLSHKRVAYDDKMVTFYLNRETSIFIWILRAAGVPCLSSLLTNPFWVVVVDVLSDVCTRSSAFLLISYTHANSTHEIGRTVVWLPKETLWWECLGWRRTATNVCPGFLFHVRTLLLVAFTTA